MERGLDIMGKDIEECDIGYITVKTMSYEVDRGSSWIDIIQTVIRRGAGTHGDMGTLIYYTLQLLLPAAATLIHFQWYNTLSTLSSAHL